MDHRTRHLHMQAMAPSQRWHSQRSPKVLRNISPSPTTQPWPLFLEATLTLHAMLSVSGMTPTQAMAPGQRWHSWRSPTVLRHMSPSPTAWPTPPFPEADLTIHAMPSISGTTSTQTMAPRQRWHQARVLRHAAPGIPRRAHMSKWTILCRQGVGFSFMFVHTRCALQTLCTLSMEIHTHIGTTMKSIFALSCCGHVTVHILHYLTRRSPCWMQFKGSRSTGGMHRFAIASL